MSIGLLVKDTSGRAIIGPETFTVRLVEAKLVSYGSMSPGRAIDVAFSSAVRSGMFAQVVPLWQSPKYRTPEELLYFNELPSTPYAVVYDGFVRLHAHRNGGSYTLGNVVIYVMTNI